MEAIAPLLPPRLAAPLVSDTVGPRASEPLAVAMPSPVALPPNETPLLLLVRFTACVLAGLVAPVVDAALALVAPADTVAPALTIPLCAPAAPPIASDVPVVAVAPGETSPIEPIAGPSSPIAVWMLVSAVVAWAPAALIPVVPVAALMEPLLFAVELEEVVCWLLASLEPVAALTEPLTAKASPLVAVVGSRMLSPRSVTTPLIASAEPVLAST